MRFLVTVLFYRLCKIPLPVQQPYGDQWQGKGTGCLAVIARQNTQAAGIDRHTLVKTELHGKVGDHVALRIQIFLESTTWRLIQVIIVIRQG